MHTDRHRLKIELWLLNLIAQDDFTIEVIVNIVKFSLRQVKDRLDLEHSKLKVVSVEQIGHVADKKLACF